MGTFPRTCSAIYRQLTVESGYFWPSQLGRGSPPPLLHGKKCMWRDWNVSLVWSESKDSAKRLRRILLKDGCGFCQETVADSAKRRGRKFCQETGAHSTKRRRWILPRDGGGFCQHPGADSAKRRRRILPKDGGGVRSLEFGPLTTYQPGAYQGYTRGIPIRMIASLVLNSDI